MKENNPGSKHIKG